DAACGTGAQRRLVLDETEHNAKLVQGGPPAPSKTAPPNGVLPVIPGERSCCDDHLNPPCEPWSERWITPRGRRAISAMPKASSTSCVASVGAIDQPTMRRLYASSTTARWRKPAQVGI